MRAWVMAVVLSAGAASAAAQVAVEVKLHSPRVGEKYRVTVQEKSTSKTTVTISGNEQKKDEVKAKALVYVDEVLAVADGSRKPTKLKRTYEKAVLTTDGKDTTPPVEKQTVLIEKNGEKYAFTVDGKPVDAETAKLLSGEFNKPDRQDVRDVVFPKKPLKPGDTWKIDPDDLTKALSDANLKLDKEKFTGTGKLVKVSKVDGKEVGVMEVKIAAMLLDSGKTQVKLKSGDLAVTMSLEGCIDGTSPAAKTAVAMKFAIDAEGQGLSVRAEVSGTETRVVELVK